MRCWNPKTRVRSEEVVISDDPTAKPYFASFENGTGFHTRQGAELVKDAIEKGHIATDNHFFNRDMDELKIREEMGRFLIVRYDNSLKTWLGDLVI